jgi:hypothetical protein
MPRAETERNHVLLRMAVLDAKRANALSELFEEFDIALGGHFLLCNRSRAKTPRAD